MYSKDSLIRIIKEEAKFKNLPDSILLGLVQVESGFNPFAVRYEPNYKYVKIVESLKPKNCSNNTEINLQKTSWGLFQIMGGTARYLGFDGWLTKLIIPEINIEYGTLYFATLYRRYVAKYGIAGVIAAYNAGSPRFDDNGNLINQHYVDKVMFNARNWI
ncbi:MAG: lytic transglycosylase domain-containing protein [Candidatus Heimdallarchaeaceae archaeon]